ncbi:MAG: hypothetical protein C4530_12840 [Desulfobacteraceae bacterium]|nr:MAG: hypothetical protein C4530_12840 [Desulfobacteraceae bacterium]
MKTRGKHRIFLTPGEAIAAIHSDFMQYEPQKPLFLNLIPLILGKETVAVKEDRKNGLWLKLSRGRRKFFTYAQLGEHLASALKNAHPPVEVLARICSMVFRAPACPGRSAEGKDGIWIETEVEVFRCRQCGRCCRTLSFHTECTVSDYERWHAAGRSDILEWVGVVRREGKIASCQIWVVPGTRQYAEGCPWLRKVPDRNVHECTIHDLRPGICRQYPGTRKHAEMTGCQGFD